MRSFRFSLITYPHKPHTTTSQNSIAKSSVKDLVYIGYEGILIVSIGVKEKPSTWEGKYLF